MALYDILELESHHNGVHCVSSCVPEHVDGPLQKIHFVSEGLRDKRGDGIGGRVAGHRQGTGVEADSVDVHKRSVVVVSEA